MESIVEDADMSISDEDFGVSEKQFQGSSSYDASSSSFFESAGRGSSIGTQIGSAVSGSTRRTDDPNVGRKHSRVEHKDLDRMCRKKLKIPNGKGPISGPMKPLYDQTMLEVLENPTWARLETSPILPMIQVSCRGNPLAAKAALQSLAKSCPALAKKLSEKENDLVNLLVQDPEFKEDSDDPAVVLAGAFAASVATATEQTILHIGNVLTSTLPPMQNALENLQRLSSNKP
jgi:hypothetical protein